METAALPLSIVLPAYNEAGIIATTVRRVAAYVTARRLDAEIIVVNDGSLDATQQTLERLQGEIPQLRILRHPKNRGYGETLRSGFSAATKEWIFQTDSDGQFDIAELDALLPHRKEADLLVGYRVNRADPFLRDVLTKGYNALVRRLFGLPLRDVGCAFKLFRREAWTAIPPVRSRDHKIFIVEWLQNAQTAGFQLQEFPVRHYPRAGGRATGASPRVVVATVRAWWDLSRRVKAT